MTDQRISFDSSAGPLDGTEIVPLVRVGAPISAGSFVVGTAYVILSVGTTDFTAIGAASNTVGIGFVATGAGSGTGTAGATNNVRTTTQTIANKAAGSIALDDLTDVIITTPANGDILTYDSSSPSHWKNAGASSGATVLISTKNASNSASLEWTGLNAFTTWRMIGRLLLPATNAVTCQLQVGTGAGPSYITSGYNYSTASWTTGGVGASNGNSSGAAFLPLAATSATVSNVSGVGVNFDIEIQTDNSTFAIMHGTGFYKDSAPAERTFITGGKIPLSAAITAFRILFNSGNITSGNASLYSVSG